jgi:hypothetical protein
MGHHDLLPRPIPQHQTRQTIGIMGGKGIHHSLLEAPHVRCTKQRRRWRLGCPQEECWRGRCRSGWQDRLGIHIGANAIRKHQLAIRSHAAMNVTLRPRRSDGQQK